jgi:predicted RNase H-like HicB family nuclease
MRSTFTAVYEREGDWYVASAEEIPGALTQGRTIEEARENLREAIALVLLANRDLSEEELCGKNVIRERIEVEFD